MRIRVLGSGAGGGFPQWNCNCPNCDGLRKGTINIGSRQNGRLKAASVLDCEPESGSICAAIDKLGSSEFQTMLADVFNPYGDGGASDRIIEQLELQPFDNLLSKSFYAVTSE